MPALTLQKVMAAIERKTMKITATQLRNIIKEEVEQALEEADVDVGADTMKMIEDFVKALRDADPEITLGKIKNELDAAFRKEKSSRTSPEERAASRSASAKKAAASRKASDEFYRSASKKSGPTWPGQLHGAPKPAGWKKSDYKWDDGEGRWVRNKFPIS